LRLALVLVGLGIWYGTQALLKYRPSGSGVIGDGLHTLTARWFRFFTEHPKWADRLLIGSSLVIDLLGGFVLVESIIGPSVRPFIGLFIVFGLRQICQAVCALPAPAGMIWRNPGFPSLLVTYGVANDLFFSGHTALAAYGAIELARWGGPVWAAVGVVVVLLETATVIVLRAHYTMDVFTGAVTAFAAAVIADWWAPAWDTALVQFGASIFGT
jgi:membrane-associated phospholipid phosphatase